MNLVSGLAALSAVLAVNVPFVIGGSPGKSHRSRMTVAVCDRIGMDKGIWLTAQRQIDRIFDYAEIEITWVDPECETRSAIEWGRLEAPTLRSLNSYFMVVIVLKPPADWHAPHAMGFAPIRTGPFPRAYVFYDLVEEFVKRYGGLQALNSNTGVILGHCVAHELGHLLIPEQAHGNGLMRDFWEQWEWQQALTGNLMFSKGHAKQIQKRLGSK